MDFKMIEIYNQKAKINNDTYNFIIEEKWFDNFRLNRKRPKFYTIKRNGKTILSTSLHQTFYSRKRNLLNG